MTSNIAAVWSIRGGTLLSLIFAGEAGDVITSGSCGCSNCEIVELKTQRSVGKASRRVHTWDWKAVLQKIIQCLSKLTVQ